MTTKLKKARRNIWPRLKVGNRKKEDIYTKFKN